MQIRRDLAAGEPRPRLRPNAVRLKDFGEPLPLFAASAARAEGGG